MNREIKMSVSSLSRKGEEKAIYVFFTDGKANAEFLLPDCKLVHSKNFSEDDLKQLKEYVSAERVYIPDSQKSKSHERISRKRTGEVS